jgi:hypothetical protein
MQRNSPLFAGQEIRFINPQSAIRNPQSAFKEYAIDRKKEGIREQR